MTNGPLTGIRVIDFGQYVAGPAVAMMMADQGAEVIRIDPLGGPMWDSPANAFLNRNKESIVLDLKNADDNCIARDLVKSADVLIENFRPGVMNRLGLGSAEMTAANLRLIYLSIPGFASTDKKRAHIQAWEGVIGAATGLFTDQGINRVLMKDGNPYYSPLTLASAYAVSLAATAVMTALLSREQTGAGDIVEVPIASAVLEGLVYNSMAFEGMPERYKTRRLIEFERRQEANEPMNLTYEEIQELLDPTYRNYLCADGRPFYNETVGIPRHVIDGLKLHGVFDEFVAEGLPLVDPWTSSNEWGDATFAISSGVSSQTWADKISSHLKASFLTKTSREWETLFEEWRLAGAAQQTTQEWLNEEHANASGLVVTVDDPVYGAMKQPGSSVWLKSSVSEAIEKKPASRPDADREAILAKLDGSGDSKEVDKSAPTGGGLPLKNIKILDISNVLGGPTIASTLARFGAEVIHISPVVPSFEPAECIVCGAQCNKGKRSVLVDLKTPEGHEILERLVKTVDLVTYNGTDKQVGGLNINHEVLLATNPDVIFCQLTAFDGPNKGPRSNRVGYDDLTQAITGVMARFGGALQKPEEHANIGTIDVMGGFLGAFASLLALFKRSRGGGPDLAKTALLNCAQMIQIPFMYDYEGRAPFDEPSGPDVLGENVFYRLYEASDGWFFLGVKADQVSDLADVTELSSLTEQSEQQIEAYLEERFKARSLAYWTEQLQAKGIGACPTDTMAAIRAGHLVNQKEAQIGFAGSSFMFLRNEAHPSGYTVDLMAPIAMRFKNAAVRIPSDQAKFGAHSREVLAEIGYGEREIGELIEKRIVATSWSDKYLPD